MSPLPGRINAPVNWKIVAKKYARGLLMAGAVLLAFDNDLIQQIISLTPEGQKALVTMVVGAALPALRNAIKTKFAVIFGGLL